MKTIIKQTIMASMFLLGIVGNTHAQSVLEKAKFEATTKLIRPKGEWVVLRSKPAANAPAAKDAFGYDVGADKHTLLNAIQETATWYKVGNNRWISKRDATAVISAPLADNIFNRFFGCCESYDYWREWTVSPVGDKGFYLCLQQGDNVCKLRLGKKIGNVLVFKYSINLRQIIYSEKPEDVNKFKREFQSVDGEIQVDLTIGSKFYREMKHGQCTDKFLNLERFNDRVIEYIFKEAIEKDITDYLYLNSTMFGTKYANYELG